MNYELTNETRTVDGHTLYRIRATADIKMPDGRTVKAGDLGGWIESTDNLRGDAFVADDACVYGDALVFHCARVFGSARVYGGARVYGNSAVFRAAQVYGSARVFGSALVGCDEQFSEGECAA